MSGLTTADHLSRVSPGRLFWRNLTRPDTYNKRLTIQLRRLRIRWVCPVGHPGQGSAWRRFDERAEDGSRAERRPGWPADDPRHPLRASLTWTLTAGVC